MSKGARELAVRDLPSEVWTQIGITESQVKSFERKPRTFRQELEDRWYSEQAAIGMPKTAVIQQALHGGVAGACAGGLLGVARIYWNDSLPRAGMFRRAGNLIAGMAVLGALTGSTLNGTMAFTASYGQATSLVVASSVSGFAGGMLVYKHPRPALGVGLGIGFINLAMMALSAIKSDLPSDVSTYRPFVSDSNA